MVKYRFIFLALWVALSVLYFFTLKHDSAPEWALDLEVLLSGGIFLILLNQAMDKLDQFFDKL
jgi:hypothetical protein